MDKIERFVVGVIIFSFSLILAGQYPVGVIRTLFTGISIIGIGFLYITLPINNSKWLTENEEMGGK